MKGKLQPGKCKKCGFTYGEHAMALREELELLRARGYAAFICRDSEDKPFGDYVEIVAVSSEGEILRTDDIEEMFKEPDDPCDKEFMKEISVPDTCHCGKPEAEHKWISEDELNSWSPEPGFKRNSCARKPSALSTNEVPDLIFKVWSPREDPCDEDYMEDISS